MKKDAQVQNQPSSSPRRRLLRGAAAIGAAAAGYGVLRELNASPVPPSATPSASPGAERAVLQLVPGELAINDGDMRLYRALPQRVRHNVGPFVFVDHYRHQSLRGLGDTPHPHAGIEVISYLLQGSMEHRDSMGFRDKLLAGDGQHIRAGRGILHAEQPLSGRHGLQMWLSLPPALAAAEPTYTKIPAADVPRFTQPGVQGEVLAGLIHGQQGPMQLASGAMFAYTRLQAKASARFDVPEGKELAVYVVEGSVQVQGQRVDTGSLALLAPGTSISTTAADGQPAQFALIGGDPIQHEIHFGGPFVANSRQALLRMRDDYLAGKMGTLEGTPF